MKKTIENLAANTILQKETEIKIGGKKYNVAPPTAGTLIEISSLVSAIPFVDTNTDDEISETLRVAKDCDLVFDIIATLILGAKKRRTIVALMHKAKYEKLRNRLKHVATPQELSDVTGNLLMNHSEIQVFFSLITSLSGINLLKPTKNATTASGRQ